MLVHQRLYPSLHIKESPAQLFEKAENLSSEALARVIRFNAVCSAVGCYILLFICAWRAYVLRAAATAKLVVALLLCAVEGGRLRLGSCGNRSESFAQVSAFVVLCVPAVALALTFVLLGGCFPLEVFFCGLCAALAAGAAPLAIRLLLRLSRDRRRWLRLLRTEGR